MITKQSIEDLKQHIDIVDVISQAIELKKSGANFKACCPFHGEETASFVVSPVKQICHCFGCKAGGDAIKFVQEYNKLSYPEALEHIAADLNFTLEYDNKTEQKDYKGIFESINNYYKKSLQGKELQYLFDRGITQESIDIFEIGFATDSKTQLAMLKQNFLNLQDAQDIGVLATGETGIYARQSNRITFPIKNRTNKLIGFGGRTVSGHSAKYINTPATRLFDKSRNLYGYNIAKDYIYKKGTIVITEGYLDVVMMHQAGIKTAVATMGTALTKEHIPTLKRGKIKALVCYDGDKAGREAAYKASVLLSQYEVDGAVVIFDDGIDPADMVALGKVAELIAIMKKPTPLMKYALQHITAKYDMNSPLNKNEALKECIELLKSLNNPLIANEYKPYLAQLLSIDISHINIENPRPIQVPTPQNFLQGNSGIELNIIATALEDIQALNIITQHCIVELFEDHRSELSILLNGGDIDTLTPMLLLDDIKIYTESELKSQLCILLINFNTKKLNEIRYNKEISYKDKTTQIKDIQMNILKYKKGVL